MKLRMSIDRMFARANGTRKGENLLIATLLLAGIGAAAVPLVADLVSAAAGVLIVALILESLADRNAGRGMGKLFVAHAPPADCAGIS